MVSYRIKRLNDGGLPSRALRAAGAGTLRRFGAPWLSTVGEPRPSVQVDQTPYARPASPRDTCWGTVSGSGPNAEAGGPRFDPSAPGSCG